VATSNKRLNEYVGFLNALNRAEITAIKLAAGPMDMMGGGGMPVDPAMMGGGGGGMPMDPAMMGGGGGMPVDPAMMGGGGGMPMDPGMAMGIPGGIDPAALGLPPGMGGAMGGAMEPAVDPAIEEEKALADKALIAKSLEVSDKALDLAQAQTAKIEELLGGMEGAESAPLEPEISPEEIQALLQAKGQSPEGMF